ncbi:MAG: efflux transporter outer membrane subunit, partial [Desulfomonilia bacterium]|nr:efflux transporter outer membrane subunit [Desulfomonilia bacterium]
MKCTAEHRPLVVSRVLWFILMASVAGCAIVGQDHVRPELDLSDTWNTQINMGLSRSEPDPQDLAAWWRTIEDPALDTLIEIAIEHNLDLKSSLARLRQARAARTLASSSLFPAINASGSASRSSSGSDSGSGSARTRYVAGFDAGWEIDLFGGVRRSVEAAEADLQARLEQGNDVLVSLTAEVALNYLELRMYQARLSVAQRNLEIQEEIFQLEEFRLLSGLSDELTVAQARATMENTRAGIPTLHTQIAQTRNRISVLLGEQPGVLPEALNVVTPLPSLPIEVATGVPADILRRRPDVRQAEQELAAQTARVGVAQADLYPKFTLVGSIGYESLSLGDLITAGSRV